MHILNTFHTEVYVNNTVKSLKLDISAICKLIQSSIGKWQHLNCIDQNSNSVVDLEITCDSKSVIVKVGTKWSLTF